MVELRREVLRKPLGLDFTDKELLAEKQDVLIGAFEHDEILACCILSNPYNGYIKLRQMAVRPELQHQGIGSLLLQFAEKTALQKEYKGIILNARTTALIFYEKKGYLSYGDVFEEVGIPHIRMEKKLK